MYVIALVDYVEVRIGCFEAAVIFSHTHAGRWYAVTRLPGEMVTIGDTSDSLVLGCCAAG